MRMCWYHIVVRWSTIADLSWDCSFKSLTIICNHSFLNVCLFFVFLTLQMCPCHRTIPPLPHTQKSSGSGFFFALTPEYVCEREPLCVWVCVCVCVVWVVWAGGGDSGMPCVGGVWVCVYRKEPATMCVCVGVCVRESQPLC